jgi:hypothetical protein
LSTSSPSTAAHRRSNPHIPVVAVQNARRSSARGRSSAPGTPPAGCAAAVAVAHTSTTRSPPVA